MENAKLLKGAVFHKYVPSLRRIRSSMDKNRQVLLQNLVCPLVFQVRYSFKPPELQRYPARGWAASYWLRWPPHIVPMRVSPFQAVYSSCLQCRHTIMQQHTIRKLDAFSTNRLPYVLSSTATPDKHLIKLLRAEQRRPSLHQGKSLAIQLQMMLSSI